MVNISRFISAKKNEFRSYRDRTKLMKIQQETARLERERERQAEFSKALAKKQMVERDVNNITSYNKKVETPSKLKVLASNVRTQLEKSKVRLDQKNKESNFKGLRPKTLLGESTNKLNLGGSKDLDFGGKKDSPFKY